MTTHPAARADRGFSLVEILVAVSLLGLAVVGTMSAMWTSVRTSDLQETLAGARRWIVTAGDYGVSPTLVPVDCATPSTYDVQIHDASRPSRPPGWPDDRLVITGVTFWDGVEFASTCSPAVLQQIALRVTSPDGEVTETLEVVKNGR